MSAGDIIGALVILPSIIILLGFAIAMGNAFFFDRPGKFAKLLVLPIGLAIMSAPGLVIVIVWMALTS